VPINNGTGIIPIPIVAAVAVLLGGSFFIDGAQPARSIGTPRSP
jgi:hypothetical protein